MNWLLFSCQKSRTSSSVMSAGFLEALVEYRLLFLLLMADTRHGVRILNLHHCCRQYDFVWASRLWNTYLLYLCTCPLNLFVGQFTLLPHTCSIYAFAELCRYEESTMREWSVAKVDFVFKL